MRWITLTRLRRTTGPRSRYDDHLGFARQVHPEAPLGYRHDYRTRRAEANRLRQANSLAFECGLLPEQRRQLDAFPVTVAPARDHCGGNEYERNEAAGNHPAAALQPSLRHARRRALLARGLREISSSVAVIALRVINLPRARPRHVHAGCRGGQMQSVDQSRIACFTRRSSPEWYEMTARTPPGVSRSLSAGSADSRAPSSSFTA